MIACVDVNYDVDEAQAACLVFENWTSAVETSLYVTRIKGIDPYVPGEFYKRELPCLIRILSAVREPLDIILVDGHVWTAPGTVGLGGRLYEVLGRGTVVGVAKTHYHSSPAVPVLRGGSTAALFVDEVGDPVGAPSRIVEMHGPFRIPTMLKKVDKLCREGKA